jgi:hypothetical protein
MKLKWKIPIDSLCPFYDYTPPPNICAFTRNVSFRQVEIFMRNRLKLLEKIKKQERRMKTK